MPNWCGNSVTLRHENPEMIKRAVDAFAAGRFCQEFNPIPAELKDTQSPNGVNAADLIEKTGYADWYDFCTNEWGTKWDFGSGDGINEVQTNECVLYFDSAWSPPIGIYETLIGEGFEVYADFHEPGMCFVGRFCNGEIEEYEATPGNCPEDMDEMWCITETAEMYADEDADETEV